MGMDWLMGSDPEVTPTSLTSPEQSEALNFSLSALQDVSQGGAPTTWRNPLASQMPGFSDLQNQLLGSFGPSSTWGQGQEFIGNAMQPFERFLPIEDEAFRRNVTEPGLEDLDKVFAALDRSYSGQIGDAGRFKRRSDSAEDFAGELAAKRAAYLAQRVRDRENLGISALSQIPGQIDPLFRAGNMQRQVPLEQWGAQMTETNRQMDELFRYLRTIGQLGVAPTMENIVEKGSEGMLSTILAAGGTAFGGAAGGAAGKGLGEMITGP